jgi:hypothetical protein
MPKPGKPEAVELPRFISTYVNECSRILKARQRPSRYNRVISALLDLFGSAILFARAGKRPRSERLVFWDIKWLSAYDEMTMKPSGSVRSRWIARSSGTDLELYRPLEVDANAADFHYDRLNVHNLNFAVNATSDACVLERIAPNGVSERSLRMLPEGMRSNGLGDPIRAPIIEGAPRRIAGGKT